MSKWIEINLPWYCYNTERVQFPLEDEAEIKRRAKKIFGKTPDDYDKKILFELSELLTQEINSVLAEKYPDGDSSEEKRKEIREIVYKNNPKLLALKDYHEFHKKYDAWWYEQPEVKNWDEANKKKDEANKLKSFTGRNLNQPGTIVEIEIDGKLHQFLIGDINCNSGVCDDCRAFESNAIVKRYKVINYK